ITMPGITFYCGSKFALEGISEALGKEVASFGIRVTALAPGQFRTDWAGRSMDRTSRSIADYDAVRGAVRVTDDLAEMPPGLVFRTISFEIRHRRP
ncbi:SDR family NAD(P)-dependent oxidoreductase, partial [Lactiplantibacillus plantarum]|nr:SDR family NAD(P)-dependent oxidoreductase [Lactiplantibacillus plantarum]